MVHFSGSADANFSKFIDVVESDPEVFGDCVAFWFCFDGCVVGVLWCFQSDGFVWSLGVVDVGEFV